MTDTKINKPLTVKQMTEIYQEVATKHEWPFNGQKIKYIDTTYDNRGCDIFRVQFRGCNDKIFTCTNRSEENVILYDEIMEWLIAGRTQMKVNSRFKA